jgi:hypothetical protein
MIRSPHRISTQEVLPPYRTVSGPGQAILPRTPQNRTVYSGWTKIRVTILLSLLPYIVGFHKKSYMSAPVLNGFGNFFAIFFLTSR